MFLLVRSVSHHCWRLLPEPVLELISDDASYVKAKVGVLSQYRTGPYPTFVLRCHQSPLSAGLLFFISCVELVEALFVCASLPSLPKLSVSFDILLSSCH